MKPFTRLTTSAPVVTVTVRKPVNATDEMVILAVADVALLTATELTVMPVPNPAVVVPFTKCVLRPVIVTLSVCPCCPVLGTADSRLAVEVFVSEKVTEVRPVAEAVTA